MSHKNPYREGSNYHLVFAFVQKQRVITRSELVKFLTGKCKLGEAAALATATVILSPREKHSKRGDCRGNLSAMGHIYFMQPLKKVVGAEKKFRLRWRVKELARRDYERPSTIASKKEVKQEKTATPKKVAPAKETVTA